MRTIGPKEQAQRDLGARRYASGLTDEGKAGRAERATKAIETGTARATAAADRAKAKKAAKTAGGGKAKPAASPAGPEGLRPGTKQAKMLSMLLRPEGATEKAICKAIGWKKCRVTIVRVCEKVGATLTKKVAENPKGKVTTYFATMPAGQRTPA